MASVCITFSASPISSATIRENSSRSRLHAAARDFVAVLIRVIERRFRFLGQPGRSRRFEAGRQGYFAVDGQKLVSALAISDYIKQHAGQPVAITVKRDGKRLTVKVTPEVPVGDKFARIGIRLG